MSTLFVDVDTQLDFLYPAGALYAHGAERIVPAVAQLNRFAAANDIPVLSSVDAHSEDDPEFRVWPKHCVAGCLGQQKAPATLLERRAVIPNRAGEFTIAGAQQIVLEKQTVDIFQTRNLARFLETLQPDRFVVYGVVTEVCVLHAVRGLMRFGKPVHVVSDAIQPLTAKGSRDAVEEMLAAGAAISSVGAETVAREAHR